MKLRRAVVAADFARETEAALRGFPTAAPERQEPRTTVRGSLVLLVGYCASVRDQAGVTFSA